VKQNGAQYFRRLQPYHQYFSQPPDRTEIEEIPERVFISNLLGGMLGWQIDGPKYPKHHGERQYTNRWVRFGGASTARFYRDHIQEDQLRQEFIQLRKRFDYSDGLENSQVLRDDAHIMPSLVRIMSLTLQPDLNEIEKLSQNAGRYIPFKRWRLWPDASVFASAISILRLNHPPEYDRLIPKSGKPSPWFLGLERKIASQWSILVQNIQTRSNQKVVSWPVVSWDCWLPPKKPQDLPGSEKWSFGMVTPKPGSPPANGQTWNQLNWNTYYAWIE
jgi:hypothetical protein